MKITITGSQGFIGKNLVARLAYLPNIQLSLLDRQSTIQTMQLALKETDLIIHLAGESRSRELSNQFKNNLIYTQHIIQFAKQETPCIFASTNRKNHQAYWETKQQEEALLQGHFHHLKIVRMDNIFGKWAKPYYNSVVATFIDGTIRNQTFPLFHPLTPIPFLYIDDVIDWVVAHMDNILGQKIEILKGNDLVTPQALLDAVIQIHQQYMAGTWLTSHDLFLQRLQVTYLSYLPSTQLLQTPVQYPDQRGNFIELMKSQIPGQVSLNIILPGYRKGNHFHHVRWEKFMLIDGEGEFRLRQKFSPSILTFKTSDLKLKLCTIPPGYIHEIVNTGKSQMIVWMWSSLVYDPQKPDTYQENI